MPSVSIDLRSIFGCIMEAKIANPQNKIYKTTLKDSNLGSTACKIRGQVPCYKIFQSMLL